MCYVWIRRGQSDKIIYANMMLNKKMFQVDCEAALNVIPQKYVRDADLQLPTKKLQMWNGSELESLSKCRIALHSPKYTKNIRLNSMWSREIYSPSLQVMRVSQQMNLITLSYDYVDNVNSASEYNCWPTTQMSSTVNCINYPGRFIYKLTKLPYRVMLHLGACQCLWFLMLKRIKAIGKNLELSFLSTYQHTGIVKLSLQQRTRVTYVFALIRNPWTKKWSANDTSYQP